MAEGNNPKPLIFNETGKEIVQMLRALNANVGAIAKKQMNISDDWSSIQDIVNSGNAENIFSIGGIFTEKYVNVDSSNKEYDMPWRINDFRDYEVESGDTVHGMILQSEYATLQAVQFSNIRAFLSCSEGLTAGTYHLTLGENWGNNAKKDKIYQFTLTKDVPKGGRLAGFKYMPDTNPSGWKVYSYLADAKTLAETVDVSEGSGGIDLGVMNYNTRRVIENNEELGLKNLTMNSMQETAYGCNRWATSAMRQWLNSDAGKNEWWKQQDAFDIAPDQLATTSGFLAGMPVELKSKLKRVKVVTAKNNPTEGGGTDITYDRVFLPSLEELYVTRQIAGEGEYHKYWKLRAGTTSPVPQYKENDRYKNYALENHTSAQYVRLRSAYVGYAYYVWIVNPSGYVHYNGATNAWRGVPLIVI